MVRDLFISRIRAKDLQTKLCAERLTPEAVLDQTLAYERSTSLEKQFSNLQRTWPDIPHATTYKDRTSICQKSPSHKKKTPEPLSHRGLPTKDPINQNIRPADNCKYCGKKFDYRHNCPTLQFTCSICKHTGQQYAVPHDKTLLDVLTLYYFIMRLYQKNQEPTYPKMTRQTN